MGAKEIGLFNADAGFPPLNIDPFETALSLSGKPIAAVLRKNISRSWSKRITRTMNTKIEQIATY
jgi:hypothetical protein